MFACQTEKAHLRAQQDELARLIRRFEAVEAARVYLNVPAGAQRANAAAVVLRLAPDAWLDEWYVQRVAFLVSANVEGLAPNNVIVIDEKGRALPLREARAKVDQTRRLEEYLAERIEREVVPAKAAAKVSIMLDEQRAQCTAEDIDNGAPASFKAMANDIKKMSIVALIDAASEGLSGDLAAITGQIKKAVGFNEERGDHLAVFSAPFQIVENVQPRAIKPKTIGNLLAVIAALLILLFAARSLARRKPSQKERSATGRKDDSLPAAKTWEQHRAQAREIAFRDQRAVISIIRRWLNEPVAARRSAEGKETLLGAQKAAALLMCLGENLAAEVVKKLPEDELRQIVNAAPRLAGVTPGELETVLDEFSAPPAADAGGPADGPDFMEKVVLEALGPDKAQAVLARLKIARQLERIRRHDARTIHDLIRQEQPQTTAFVLSQLAPATAAEVIARLPDELRHELVLRIARLDPAIPGALTDVVNALGRELSTFEIGAAEPAGGIEPAAAILQAMRRDEASEIIGKIEQEDGPLADQLARRVFAFEDLLAVDDRAMQAILAAVDQVDLAAALRMAGDELKEKIFRNIPARAAKAVRRQMKTHGPLRVSEIKKAQQVIIGVARRLEQEGKIVIAANGDERLV